jgi:predicted nucleotidyltransferase
MAQYRATARRREAEASQDAVARAARARVIASQAATLLKLQFQARRVVLFGSLARADYFHPRSDIDLAVEGISVQNFWRAWCALDTLGNEFEIDLVATESAPPALKFHIDQEGVEL